MPGFDGVSLYSCRYISQPRRFGCFFDSCCRDGILLVCSYDTGSTEPRIIRVPNASVHRSTHSVFFFFASPRASSCNCCVHTPMPQACFLQAFEQGVFFLCVFCSGALFEPRCSPLPFLSGCYTGRKGKAKEKAAASKASHQTAFAGRKAASTAASPKARQRGGCKAPDCDRTASFGFPGTTRKFCSKHSVEGRRWEQHGSSGGVLLFCITRCFLSPAAAGSPPALAPPAQQ